ncbi:MAG: hypothetical protein HC892_01305 [Saprospiraceae bacterium]|nr:hypothetical protein [Saprospiraceae bacterium]
MLSNLQAGTYELKAAAVDNLNDFGQTIVTFTVGATTGGGGGGGTPTNTPPTVTITNPTNGQTFNTGSNITVTANASDADGTVANVTLYYDGVLVSTDATAPYSWNINNLATGSHTLRTVATDNQGATTETTISINVTSTSGGGNSLPMVSFKTPVNGEIVSVGTNLFVEVLATDSDGTINDIDLYFDGQLVRNERAAPYEWGKSTQNDVLLQNLQAGTRTLRAVATDNRNGVSEQTITIQVGAGTTNAPPTVAFTAPANGQTFPAGTTLNVSVNASDSDGTIAKVDLFLNGQFIRTDVTAPYTWGNGDALLTNLQAGSYTLLATATDDDNATTSRSIVFTVTATTANTAPTVNFVTPNNQQVFNEGTNLFVKIDATDNDGAVVGVQLYLNEVIVRDDTSAPFEWGNDPSADPLLQNLKAGNYTLRAVARDDDGATNESTIRIEVITVGGNFLPVVSFATPTDGQVFPAGSNIYVRVNATDSDGTVSNVRLNLNGSFIRRESLAPYEWGDPAQSNDTPLYNLAPGQYQLSAIAFDNAGGRSTATITITVSNSANDDNSSLGRMNNSSNLLWVQEVLPNVLGLEEDDNEIEENADILESRSQTLDLVSGTSMILVYPNPTDKLLTIAFLEALQTNVKSRALQ